MSTVLADIEASLAELAHTPDCESRLHGDGPRPPAHVWVAVHACGDLMLCGRCHWLEGDWITGVLSRGGVVHCSSCSRDFTSHEALITRVVLL